MRESLTVFDKTYGWYLNQLAECDTLGRADRLGTEVRDDALIFNFLNEPFSVSRVGVVGPQGKEPGFSESIVLLNYILRCPETLPSRGDWITYRDVKGSGPLAVYFSANAVKPVEKRFAGNISQLADVCGKLGGKQDPTGDSYDLAVTFDLLPRIPLALRFNDADKEFPPSCTLLFASDVAAWLDPESLAILAALFVHKLTEKKV